MTRPALAAVTILARTALLVAAALLAAGAAPAQTPASAPGDSLRSAVEDSLRAAVEDSLRAAREKAAIDSLNAYWRNLDSGWYEPLTPQALRFGMRDSALDSLTGKGDRELAALARGERWSLTTDPFGRLGFNRVEGWRLGVTATARRIGRHQPQLQLGLGYGTARRRIVTDGAFTLPLLASRAPAARDLEPGPVAGRPPPRPWPLLTLDISAETRTGVFGGSAGIVHSFSAMLDGSDANSYYDRNAALAELVWRPRPAIDLRGGGFWERHLPVPLATRWSLSGSRDRVRLNEQIPLFSSRGVAGALGWRWGRVDGRARAEWHWTTGSPFVDSLSAPVGLAPPAIPGADGRSLRRLTAALRGVWIDSHGNECELRGSWWHFDRQPPPEWRTYLGGSQTLRGYGSQEIVGDRAALASLDLRLGSDPLRALHAPLLGKLGLQPILFADWGWARAVDGPRPLAGPTGWRADAGLGLGKLIGAAGLGGWLRFYLAHPVFNRQAERSWQLQIELES